MADYEQDDFEYAGIHPLNVPPALTNTRINKRRQLEITRFVSAYVELEDSQAVALKLNKNILYVNRMLKDPHVRHIIRSRLEEKILESQVTPGRVALKLYQDLLVADPRYSPKIAAAILEIMKFCKESTENTDTTNEAPISINYQVIENDS